MEQVVHRTLESTIDMAQSAVLSLLPPFHRLLVLAAILLSNAVAFAVPSVVFVTGP
jgi:hypothetical protein